MMFMEDSERAAAIARERGVDAGLHLNFTIPFSGPGTPVAVVEHQQRLSRYLRRHRLAQAVFHPGLANSFEYVVRSQLQEFERLYGAQPDRVDGHHHMHLCANVVLQHLLPSGTVVRRNFSFEPGEKSFLNRVYRQAVDRILRRRHHLTDFFFSLSPLVPPSRLQKILSLSKAFTVEVETHPIKPDEFCFLAGGAISRAAEDFPIAPGFALARRHICPA
jgi:hypothetical protein